MPQKTKVKTISATDLQRQSGQIIRRVYKGEHVIVERGGIPLIAIVPLKEYLEYLEQVKLTAQATPSQ